MTSTITLTDRTITATLAYEQSGVRAIIKGGGFTWDASTKEWTRTFDSPAAAMRWIAMTLDAGGSRVNRTNKHYWEFRSLIDQATLDQVIVANRGFFGDRIVAEATERIAAVAA